MLETMPEYACALKPNSNADTKRLFEGEDWAGNQA